MAETERSDLTDFLLAWIAEDAENTDELHNRYCEVNSPVSFPCDCGVPARVLAEVEAKRRIVELHGGGPVAVVEDTGLDDEHGERIYACGGCGRSTPCPTLRALASVYVGHDGFREEWL